MITKIGRRAFCLVVALGVALIVPVTARAQDTTPEEPSIAAKPWAVGVSAEAGGTVATTGLVMMFLNRPRPFQLEDQLAAQPASVSVVPVVGPGLVGVSSAFEF